MEQILDNIYRIDIPLPKNPLRVLNSYVFLGGERTLVLDTGFDLPECRDALRNGLAELNVNRDQVDVLLTHAHSDHGDLAPELAGTHGSVFISGVDLPWQRYSTAVPLWKNEVQTMVHCGFPADQLDWTKHEDGKPSELFKTFDRYVPLEDGDRIPAGQYQLTCIHTPGHTPGHFCYYLEDEQAMFTGDHVLFDITPNITNWEGITDSLGDYLNSLRMVRNIPVRQAFPGHRAAGSYYERIDALLESHHRRLEECLTIVSRRSGQNAFEIAAQMKWNLRATGWEAFPPMQQFFATGECVAHLKHLIACGQVVQSVCHGQVVYDRQYAAAGSL